MIVSAVSKTYLYSPKTFQIDFFLALKEVLQ